MTDTHQMLNRRQSVALSSLRQTKKILTNGGSGIGANSHNDTYAQANSGERPGNSAVYSHGDKNNPNSSQKYSIISRNSGSKSSHSPLYPLIRQTSAMKCIKLSQNLLFSGSKGKCNNADGAISGKDSPNEKEDGHYNAIIKEIRLSSEDKLNGALSSEFTFENDDFPALSSSTHSTTRNLLPNQKLPNETILRHFPHAITSMNDTGGSASGNKNSDDTRNNFSLDKPENEQSGSVVPAMLLINRNRKKNGDSSSLTTIPTTQRHFLSNVSTENVCPSQSSPQQERHNQGDAYDMYGLLKVLEMTDYDLTNIALGIDMTTLGFNLSSKEYSFCWCFMFMWFASGVFRTMFIHCKQPVVHRVAFYDRITKFVVQSYELGNVIL